MERAQPSSPTLNEPTVEDWDSNTATPSALTLKEQQPSTPTLTETAAVARQTTAVRDYYVHVGYEQAQQPSTMTNAITWELMALPMTTNAIDIERAQRPLRH